MLLSRRELTPGGISNSLICCTLRFTHDKWNFAESQRKNRISSYNDSVLHTAYNRSQINSVTFWRKKTLLIFTNYWKTNTYNKMTILTKPNSGVKLNPKGANSLESGTIIEQVHFFLSTLTIHMTSYFSIEHFNCLWNIRILYFDSFHCGNVFDCL